jgi:hypothetical protein
MFERWMFEKTGQALCHALSQVLGQAHGLRDGRFRVDQLAMRGGPSPRRLHAFLERSATDPQDQS